MNGVAVRAIAAKLWENEDTQQIKVFRHVGPWGDLKNEGKKGINIPIIYPIIYPSISYIICIVLLNYVHHQY